MAAGEKTAENQGEMTINRSAVRAAESITAILCHLAVRRETLVHYIIGHPSLLMSFVTIISLGPLTPAPTKTNQPECVGKVSPGKYLNTFKDKF